MGAGPAGRAGALRGCRLQEARALQRAAAAGSGSAYDRAIEPGALVVVAALRRVTLRRASPRAECRVAASRRRGALSAHKTLPGGCRRHSLPRHPQRTAQRTAPRTAQRTAPAKTSRAEQLQVHGVNVSCSVSPRTRPPSPSRCPSAPAVCPVRCAPSPAPT